MKSNLIEGFQGFLPVAADHHEDESPIRRLVTPVCLNRCHFFSVIPPAAAPLAITNTAGQTTHLSLRSRQIATGQTRVFFDYFRYPA